MPLLDLRAIAPGLELGPEGWWSARTVADVSYPEEGNAVYFAVEDSSFWFRHRNRCILEASPPSFSLHPACFSMLAAGMGMSHGVFRTQDWKRFWWSLESPESGNALKREIRHVVHATLEDAGVRPGTIPVVGLFDVVEHIPGDLEFLNSIRSLLVPGGRVYITVPAYEWLWSDEDVSAGHSRRYTVSALRRVLEQAGFSVEMATYFFGFLPLPILLRRVLPYRLGIASKNVSEAAVFRSDHEPGQSRRRSHG